MGELRRPEVAGALIRTQERERQRREADRFEAASLPVREKLSEPDRDKSRRQVVSLNPFFSRVPRVVDSLEGLTRRSQTTGAAEAGARS